MSNTPNLAMPYLVVGQSQKEVTHNDALNDVDSLVQLSVLDRALNTPPGSPAEGDSYITGSSPTGLWAGQANKIASYYSGWRFKAPEEGWLAYVRDEDIYYYYTGSARTASTAAPASQADMETATSTIAAVTPAVVKYAPGVVKAWAHIQNSSGTPINGGTGNLNVSSYTDQGTGDWQINLSITLSDANKICCLATAHGDSSAKKYFAKIRDFSTTMVRVQVFDDAGTLTDPDRLFVAVLGDL